MNLTNNPPVLILGGQENAISLARSFGERQIPVFLSSTHNCFAAKSKYCKKSYPIPADADAETFWIELLLSGNNPQLHGSVIMVGSDAALEFVAYNKQALSQNYLLDDHLPEMHMSMLDKQQTLELGAAAGCHTPFFHNIDCLDDVKQILDTVMYPAMIKPIHSHLFQRHYMWKKYLIANNEEELLSQVKDMIDKDLQLMITEMIPGPDDLQSAYYTYMDEQGQELFSYTHKIIRRYPKNSGGGCLHITEWLPETAEMGKRFFQGIGYRGLGHIEFKYDLRDNKLKIIECNPRFSAAQAIVVKSGLDMAYIMYCHIIGRENNDPRGGSGPGGYRQGVRRWLVLQDLFSFRELYRLGEITFKEWLQSIKGPPLVFAYFKLSDLGPFFAKIRHDGNEIYKHKIHPRLQSLKSS